jgi:tRNA-binding EMAP/Myf-like protein
MVNYVYQPKTLGPFLAIYFAPLLEVTHHQREADVIKIYHGQTLIGVNIEQPESKFGPLPTGLIRHFNPKQFEAIQQWLKQPPYAISLPAFTSGFRIGKIVKVEEHPEADALYVTAVDFGDQVIQIVTNSQKVKPNTKVVVALPGAMLLDGHLIVEGPMLKVNSQGMLTSQKTLGINPETQTGVYLLPEDAIIGKDFYGQ